MVSIFLLRENFMTVMVMLDFDIKEGKLDEFLLQFLLPQQTPLLLKSVVLMIESE